MASKKKASKLAHPRPKTLFEFIKIFWLPISGFIGAVLLFIELVQKWSENSQRVIVSISSIGLAVLLIFLWWIAYRTEGNKFVFIQKNRTNDNFLYKPVYRLMARVSFLLIVASIFLGLVVMNFLSWQNEKSTQAKIIILLATFDGPEEVYGFSSELSEELVYATKHTKDVEIVSIPDVITTNSQGGGTKYAQELGRKYNADLVIWGWYRPIENPNINIHFESLSDDQLSVLKKSGVLQPVAKLSDLENFAIQQKTSGEITSLVSFIIGIANFQVEDYEAAIMYFNDALAYSEWTELLVNAADAFFYRGFSNYMMYDIEEAIQDYDQAIDKQPEFAYAYMMRGMAYNDLGNYDQAILDYDKSIKWDSDNTFAYALRGLTFYNLVQYDKAIADYNQAISLNCCIAEHYNSRGLAYYGLADNEKALADYNYALLLDSSLPDVYTNRGNSYDDLGQHDLAIANYDKSILLDPNSANSYFNRGLSYYRVLQYERAIKDFDMAISLDPDYVDAYGARGNSYDYLGQRDLAIKDYDKAISLDPMDPDAYYDRGLVYSSLGQYNDAIADYSQAIFLDSNYTDAYINRSITYQKIGNQLAASNDMKKYLELKNHP